MSYKYRHDYKYHEFIDYVERTPRLSGNDNSSETTWDNSWYQTDSFKEALDLAKYGWDSGIEEIKSVFTEIAITGSTEIEWNVAGWIVDVPKYLNWEPDCMIEFIDVVDRDRPQLTIFISLTYNWWTGWNTALNYLKDVIKYVVEKMATHELRIIGVFSAQESGWDELIKVTIKDFNQNLVLNSFAFAFHPSFFRRLWFKHLETQKYWRYGYWRLRDSEIEELVEDEPKWEYALVPEVRSGWLKRSNIKTLKK